MDTMPWIRGLPPPSDPIGIIVTLIGGAIGLVVLWFLLRVVIALLALLFAPIIRWLNGPL